MSGLAAEVPALAGARPRPALAADARAADAAVPASMQLLRPASPWNWPTDSNGTSSAVLYDFCSWMPESASALAAYAASTTRFSDGYGLFLRCLQPDPMTSDALTAFADPRFRTTVLYGESTQPQLPAWNISMFPQAWIASVSGGSSTGGTIHVPLPDEGEQAGAPSGSTCFAAVSSDGSDTPVPLQAGAGQYLDISADAWGLITVRPAGWYNGALPRVRRDGPYATGDATTFFGSDGVLRNLLTGMYVALHPTVEASVTPAFATALQQRVAPGASVRIGGLVFDSLDVTVGAGGRTGPGGPAPGLLTSVVASSAPSDAVIVGVTVASLAGTS